MTTSDDRRPDLLTRLSRLNPTTVVFATVALFLGVLLLPDRIGGLLILLIVAGLVALLRRTWLVLAPGARALRLAMLAVPVGVAAVKLLS